jgi:tRNA pseudouridine32 synthase/23S rRNA pseudouridine746 synthase/23S rRNA pseudouridine1911/1915/1917 synthase
VKGRLPFPVLHEDLDVIVVAKPAGMLTVRTRRGESATVEEYLNDYVRKGQAKSRKRVYPVHRLDRETSGVMMFAKSEEVSEKFRSNWNALTEKTYLARVEGKLAPESGFFESYLRDDPKTMKVSSVKDPRFGKLARTEWRRLSESAGSTLVEVTLKSGRKNQIRVHFSEAGHPLVGDVKYGGRRAERLYLHSYRLRFKHPHSGRWLEFTEEWR